jgi:hypothetical protein
METKDQSENKAIGREEDWAVLIQESPKLKRKKVTFILRIVGFLLILAAFGILMLWRSGTLPPVFHPISLGVGVGGFILYFGSRLFEIIAPHFLDKKNA